MDNIIRAHQAVWSSDGLLLLFLLSIILFSRSRESTRKTIAIYAALMLLIVYNPLAARVFYRFLGDDDDISFVRFFWLIPVFLMIAVAAADLLFLRKGKQRWISFVIMLLVVLLCGEFFKGFFRVPDNIYKLSQGSVDASDAILADAGISADATLDQPEERPLVFMAGFGNVDMDGSADNEMYYGIRQYTGLLRMRYQQLQEKELQSAESVSALLPTGADYYILPDAEGVADRMLEEGYLWIGRTNGYVVFRNNTELTVYIVRHGRTEANDASILMGAGGDAPLTEEGIEAVQQLGRALARVRFRTVYTSPAGRTKETARILLAENDTGCDDIREQTDLRDADLGLLEGMRTDEVAEVYGDADWFGPVNDPLYQSPFGAENAYALYGRFQHVFEGVRDDVAGEDRCGVLMVAHSSLGIWLEETFQDERYDRLSNAGLTVVQYRDGAWRMCIFDRTDFWNMKAGYGVLSDAL